MKANHLILTSCLVTFLHNLYAQPAGSYYTPTVIQGQNITLPDPNLYPFYETFYGPSALFSPGLTGADMTIKEAAFVEYKAGAEITLTDGFTAGSFNAGSANSNSGEFKAYIDKSLDIITIAPDQSQIDADHILHVKKWEKFEMAVRMPPEYEDAIQTFFHRHLAYVDNLPNTVAPYPGVINPYSGFIPVSGNPELNPYAFDSLEVKFDFISPSGVTYTKYGFFMREVTWGDPLEVVPITIPPSYLAGSERPIEDVGNPLNDFHFHVRFAPVEETTGNQVWRINMSIKAPAISSLPAYSIHLTDFKCDAPDADKHGYLKVNANTQRNLQFDDGTGFFGYGENITDQWNGFNEDLMAATGNGAWNCFYKKNFDDHIQTINELASAGGNMIRLIMFGTNYAFMTEDLNSYDAYYSNITCLNGDPNFYTGNRQYWTRKMDEIIDLCYTKNIYIKLNSLISFPQIWAEWQNHGHNMFYKKFVHEFDQAPNPAGTPLPIEHFFKNSSLHILTTATEEVEYYWKRYFKYLMSRWGYSINLGVLEPMGEVNQTMGYTPAKYTTMHYVLNTSQQWEWQYIEGHGQVCDNHRSLYTAAKSNTIRDAIDDWYTMVGEYIRDPGYSGGLKDRYIPMAVSYTGYPNWAINNWPDKKAYCLHFYNPQIDLVEFHNYLDDQNVFKQVSDLTTQVFNAGGYNVNKPFSIGEGGTFGSILVPTSSDPNHKESTNRYYNNNNISHHNEIWGSAFLGNFHSQLSWFVETTHRWKDSNPQPIDVIPSARNLGDQFSFVDVAGATILNSTDLIKSSFENFTPLNDFIDFHNIDFSDNWVPHSFYDDQSQNVECYYMTNGSESKGFGWIHNINYYWENKYYYWADQPNQIPYYNLNGCNPSNITSGIILEGLTPGSFYGVDFFYTRTGPAPVPFPQPTMLTADIDGKLIIDGSTLGTYLGCDDESADVAFSLLRYPNRSGANDTSYINSELNINVSPNPGKGLFKIGIQNRGEEVCTLKLFDISGRLLCQYQNIITDIYSLNLSYLSKGCYFISISQNKHEIFSKIIIQ